MTSREPALEDVLALAMRAASLGLHVAIPARVESYDAAKGCVDVKPLVKQREANGIVSSLPVIRRVPVQFPGGAGFRVIFPLAAGDVVELVFNDQAIDAWKQKGGEQDPGSIRLHDLSDAVAIPTIRPLTGAWTDAPSSSMKVGKDGGSAQAEFKDAEIVLAGGTRDASGKGHGVECGTLSGSVMVAGAPVAVTFVYTPPGSRPIPTTGPSATIEGKISEGNSKVKV